MMKRYWFDAVNLRTTGAVAKYLQTPIDFVHVDLGHGELKRSESLALNPNGVRSGSNPPARNVCAERLPAYPQHGKCFRRPRSVTRFHVD